QGVPRSCWLHLADRGIHAEDGRDPRAAHRPRLPAPHRRGRPGRRTPAGDAGHGHARIACPAAADVLGESPRQAVLPPHRELTVATEPLVRAEEVVKRFQGGRVPAIDRLTTAIGPGRVPGLVGPDGAGKTTLLRLFAALLLPDEGSIVVCGFDTRGDPTGLRQAVSYMPQRFGLYEDLTVQENLTLYADLRGVVGEERERAFDRLLRFTGLATFTSRL